MTEKMLVEQLEITIADTYAVLMLTQCIHWNFTGTGFWGLHQMTEAQYTEMFTAIDTLAERIRALGFPAPCGLPDYTRLSTIKKHNIAMLNISATCQHLLDANQQLCGSIKKAIKLSQKIDDCVSEDMLIARLQVHEKVIWMFTATISGAD